MRMLLTVSFPHEPFNTLVKEKKVGQLLNRILGELKPEALCANNSETPDCR